MKQTLAFCLVIFGLFFLAQTLHIHRGQSCGQTIDTTVWYRLTTSWQGDGKSLDIVDGKRLGSPELAETGNSSGQLWKFTLGISYDECQYYTISTLFNKKRWLFLDVNTRDYIEKDQLAMTQLYPAFTSRKWKLTKDGEWYRLSPQMQPGKSIDILNDGKNNHPWLDNTGNYSGQLWKLTPIRKIQKDEF